MSILGNYRINWIKELGLDIVTLTFFVLIVLLLGKDLSEDRQGILDLILFVGIALIMVGNALICIERTGTHQS